MSLFSKLTKNNDKSIFPWSQRKFSGSSNSAALPRFGHGAVALSSDHIVIFGGIHRGSGKKDLFVVDSNNFSISSVSASGDIPSPRTFPGLASVRNHVILYGGEPTMPDDKWDPHVYTLNLNSKQWLRIRMEGHIPVERSQHSMVANDGIVYVWGGQRAGRYLSDLFALNTNTLSSNPQWEFISPHSEGPAARAGHVSVIYDNKMFIFGGTDGDHLYNDIWAFDLAARIWIQVPAVGYIPVPRTNSSAALVDGVMYIFGGRGPDGQDLGDLCAFRIRSQRWYMFQNMGPTPSARFGLSVTAVKEKMFVVGGEAGTGKLDDASLVYILDSAKIRYPPETAHMPPESDPTSPTHPQQQPYRSTMMMNNSQSTPVRSPPPAQPSPEQHQQPYPGSVSRNGTPSTMQRELDVNSPEPSSSAPLPISPNRTNTKSFAEPSHSQQAKPRHASMVPEAARRRTRATSPMPFNDVDTSMDSVRHHPANGPMSPSSITSSENERPMFHPEDTQPPRPAPRNTMNGITPPPRPSREGVNLTSSYRHTMAPEAVLAASDKMTDDRPSSHMPRQSEMAAPTRSVSPHSMPNGRHEAEVERSLSPQQLQPKSPHRAEQRKSNPAPGEDERASLLRELKARETMITEMKKKEQWWRTEVSLARKQRGSKPDPMDEEAQLIQFDSDDKHRLFEQLVSVKTELRRVKQSIVQQAQPMSVQVDQADRMRKAALQEAAYFKAKYQALKHQQTDELARLEAERQSELERRLAAALQENESNTRALQQAQQRATHDHSARVSAEERAREAHERAQEAQEAHQRALEEIANAHERAIKAEAQTREGAARIAELTAQLAQAKDLSETHITVARLEAAHLKARNEAAALKQQLAESMDDMARLRTLLSEREETLKETHRQLEDSEIQLGMMRDALNRKGLAASPQAAPSF
ncbi:hypothetical protein BCR43DRAFT_521667 [Syncephalastrum racemosum]|uniref:Galactose oxidase n=1 Tax=Syncephalastrum racemosum TaxID=13706 RepID=A0A1X2HMU4_SYNRA|nr:hypothetical protein BCR43DRAFT_521667 [Syncephalastrum racemosum]